MKRAALLFARLPLLLATGMAAGAQAPHPPVERIQSMRTAPAMPAPHKSSYQFTLPGNADWFDTGINLNAGETITVTTTGTLTLPATGKGQPRTIDADGTARGWWDLLRQFPLNSANAGALVGRASTEEATVPFLLGKQSTLTMPTSGHLFLRTNLSPDITQSMDADSGTFKIKLQFEKFAAAAAIANASPLPPAVPDISVLLAPAVFDGVPRRVGDEAHNPGDMVNFALIGTEDQVVAAFKNAGWVAVDKTVQDAVLHGLISTLNHEAYLEMPMSTLYLFGRPQDYSFARGDPLQVAAVRHHLRLWKTNRVVDGRTLWVGSATHDNGFEKDQRNGQVTHHIDPNIDDERDFILHSFDATGGFSSAAYVTPYDAFREGRTATGGTFHSDGRILVMELK